MERATISRQQQTQRAFLGAALMDPARAREYIIKLVPGMFDEGVSRAVFSAVQQLTMAGAGGHHHGHQPGIGGPPGG